MDAVMLKELSTKLTNPITKIIKLSISQELFLNVQKSAVVVQIFKCGDPVSTSNYRPISILPTVSKVAEKIVAEQITCHLNNSYFTLHPMQFGFRANYSTETANCFLIEKIKSLLDKGGIVGAVFLDVKKAFDTVNHRILMSKLASFNFCSDTLKWIESYLSNLSLFRYRIINQLPFVCPQESHKDPYWALCYLHHISMTYHMQILMPTSKCMLTTQ